MKIKLLAIGKTDDKNLQVLIQNYEKRLKHYIKFELEIIPDLKNVKNLSETEQKEKEIIAHLPVFRKMPWAKPNS